MNEAKGIRETASNCQDTKKRGNAEEDMGAAEKDASPMARVRVPLFHLQQHVWYRPRTHDGMAGFMEK